MIEDPVATCEVCGEPVERVFRPVAVHFKGSGFYTTDYARKSKDDAKPEGKGDSDSKSSKDSGKSDSKASGEKAKSGSSKD